MSKIYKIKKETWGRKGLHISCYVGSTYDNHHEASDVMIDMECKATRNIPKDCEVTSERVWFSFFEGTTGYDFEVYQKGRPTYEAADLRVIFKLEIVEA